MGRETLQIVLVLNTLQEPQVYCAANKHYRLKGKFSQRCANEKMSCNCSIVEWKK